MPNLAFRRQSLLLLAVLAGAVPAYGQVAPLASHEVSWRSDSGFITSPRVPAGVASVAYSAVVFVPRAAWLRLKFGALVLPGSLEAGKGAYLRITSMRDGKVQILNATAAAQWSSTSAYFNGDSVTVELLAYPGSGPARLAIKSVIAGEPSSGGATDSICGPSDDRTLSSDPRMARHVPEGCTSWLFNDTNRTFITAGHCGVGAADVQEFNVPLSNSDGSIVHPGPEDQYVVDPSSVQFTSAGLGADYTYFACYPNSNTGLTAYQKQRQYFTLATSVPAAANQALRITGYGLTTTGQAPLEWSEVQKTHIGPFTILSGSTIFHQVDTTGGNSGSPIENLLTGAVIGIHTNAGCTSGLGTAANSGCAVSYPGLQAALASPRSLCQTGVGAAAGPLYAIGDGANNFGTVNTNTGNFAKIQDAPPRMEGLAYNWNIGRFYAVNNDTNPAAPGKRLYTIDPSTGVSALVAEVTGTPDPINGLGYDPFSDTLYGIAQANGQLYTINTATGVAAAVGPTNPGTWIGGLEYSPKDHTLYGIDDSAGLSKLVKWNSTSGSPVQVGALGAGVSDCNGLAVTDNGALWTINASSGQLLRIDPANGAATAVGASGGVFGSSFGMSAVLTAPTPCYANCDASTTVPVLNANDFQCFLNKFAAGDVAANCDGSTVVPVLNANDFQCFLNAFAAGCG
jgi:V8-like Glu-specific endopeptidase